VHDLGRARRLIADMTLEDIVTAYLVIASMVLSLGGIALGGGEMRNLPVAQADRGYLVSRAH
jgi:hypothetical protein